MTLKGREFLGRGWRFPVEIDRKTGRFPLVEGPQDVKQAIGLIVRTLPGERVMRPEFGCEVEVFDSMDASAIGRFENAVRQALIRYEPRIEVLDVRVSADDAVHGKLLIRVEYRLRDSNRRDNAVYAFYLRGNA